ncbi:unnamed protein product [Linum tenue]|uniref:Uncharacterized protein n=1 Tax=Linum tenue TaxID=586396 RepID=A0AAV0S262_9ROSI|nr:unnamed protein product [Linum tenue]
MAGLRLLVVPENGSVVEPPADQPPPVAGILDRRDPLELGDGG